MQRTAIDALPETELRRLLGLIGGVDPAALQRAATIYTETFCAVENMQASVAALRPVALTCPVTIPQVVREPRRATWSRVRSLRRGRARGRPAGSA